MPIQITLIKLRGHVRQNNTITRDIKIGQRLEEKGSRQEWEGVRKAGALGEEVMTKI